MLENDLKALHTQSKGDLVKWFMSIILILLVAGCADSSTAPINGFHAANLTQDFPIFVANKRKPKPDPEPGICRDRSDFGMCSDGSLCCKRSPACPDGSACQ